MSLIQIYKLTKLRFYLTIMREPNKYFNSKGEFRDTRIEQEILSNCESGDKTGLFHNWRNKLIGTPSEMTEFRWKRFVCNSDFTSLPDIYHL